MAKKLQKNENPVTTVEFNPNIEVAEFHGFEIRRKSQMVWSVGEKGDSTVRLTSFGKIRGFVNALQDVVDKRYAVLEYGLHMTIKPEEAINLFEKNDVGHVNFDMATHPCLKGLKPSKEYPLYWHILNVRNGNLKVGKPVVGMLKAEFDAHVAEMDEQQLAYARKNNSEMWARYFKQKGLELAMRVTEGHIKVVCALEPQFDWEIGTLERKFQQLGLSDEDRQAERKQAVVNARSRQTNEILAGGVIAKKEVKAAAQAAATNVPVVLNGEEFVCEPKDLVGKKVRSLRGEVYLSGDMPLRGLPNVFAAMLVAEKQGAVLEIQPQ